MAVLILGGTAEARTLALELHAAGTDVLSSLAGRVSRPTLPVGRVRSGGFGGVDGLTAFLRAGDFSGLVDATHPFAAQIGSHAAAAAAATDTPLLRLERPSWTTHPRAATWTWVDTVTEALAVGDTSRRPFITTGRQSLADYLPWADRAVLARVVDPPGFALPAAWTLITSRGPYAYADERALMADHAADLLVTKDSGGAHTAAKLDAAADLGVPVVVLTRPARPAGRTVNTVPAARAWCEQLR